MRNTLAICKKLFNNKQRNLIEKNTFATAICKKLSNNEQPPNLTDKIRKNIDNFNKLSNNEQRILIEKNTAERINKYIFDRSKIVYKTLDYFSSIGVEKVIILNDNDQSEINKIIALSFNKPHRLINVEIFKEDIFRNFVKEAKQKYPVPVDVTNLITSIYLKDGKGYSNIYFNLTF